MPVEGFHSAKNLPVVATVYEDLAVGFHSLGEECKGTLVEDFFVGRVLLLFTLNHLLSLNFIIINLININQSKGSQVGGLRDRLAPQPANFNLGSSRH